MIRKYLIRPLGRHKLKASAVFLTTIAAAIAASVLIKPKYRSESQVYIRLGRENVAIDPTATLTNDNRVVATPQVRENELNSAVAILSNRAIVERVVDKLGPEAILADGAGPEEGASGGRKLLNLGPILRWFNMPELSPRDQAVNKLLKELSVVAVTESRVVRVIYQGRSAKGSQRVVQALVAAFLDENMRLNRVPQSEEFLIEQSKRLKADLDSVEAVLCETKNRTGLATAGYQLQLLADRISAAETSLAESQRELAAVSKESESLRVTLAELPKKCVLSVVQGKPNVGADGMREQLYTLEQREKQLLATYEPSYIEVRHVQEQIASARGVLEDDSPTRGETTEGLNPTYSLLESQLLSKEALLESLGAKESRIKTEIASLLEQRTALTNADSELTRLTRERELKDTQYRTFAGKLVEAQIDRALAEQEISNIGIIQPASYEPAPVSPNPIRNLLLGIFAGCAGVIGIVYLSEGASSAVRVPVDVEQRAGMPLLLVLPEMRRSQFRSNTQTI